MYCPLVLISLVAFASCKAENSSSDKDLSAACSDFYSYACSSVKSNSPREQALEEFNQMLDEEAKLLPANLNQMFANLERTLPTIDEGSFRSQLATRCENVTFVEDYFRAAIEEIGEASSIGQPSCSEMANTIADIVLDDQRESIEQLVDVIKKVRDLVAFENIRKKNSRISEAFQRTREFFEIIRQGYLDFINGTTSDNLEHLTIWYTRAARVELEMPMRSHKFFVAEHLYSAARDYLNCTENWIMGIDNREKAFCLARAWGVTTGAIPMPTRLAQFLHDLRSLNVSVVNDRVYVRPGYALFLLNTTNDALQYGTLGVEIAREITRTSFEVSLDTRRCLQEQFTGHKCNKDVITEFVKNYRDVTVFTLSVLKSNEADETSSSLTRPTKSALNVTSRASTEIKAEYAECHTIESDLMYNIVALRVVFPALEKLQKDDRENQRTFYTRSSLMDCSDKNPLTISQINTAFSQSIHFQRVFGCKGTDPMAISKEKPCKLL